MLGCSPNEPAVGRRAFWPNKPDGWIHRHCQTNPSGRLGYASAKRAQRTMIFPQTNPTSANEANREIVAKTMLEHEQHDSWLLGRANRRYGAALWPTEPDAQPRAFLWPNDPRDRPLVDLFHETQSDRTDGASTHRPHPEEAHRSRVYPRSVHQERKSATADLRCAVSKDGRWHDLASGRPSRRAFGAPQDEASRRAQARSSG
jgi:hypothetical protein